MNIQLSKLELDEALCDYLERRLSNAYTPTNTDWRVRVREVKCDDTNGEYHATLTADVVSTKDD